MAECTHTDRIKQVTPSAEGCDSSKNKHAQKHFNSIQHPIVESFEPNEDWRWCYVDETYVD